MGFVHPMLTTCCDTHLTSARIVASSRAVEANRAGPPICHEHSSDSGFSASSTNRPPSPLTDILGGDAAFLGRREDGCRDDVDADEGWEL